MATLHQVDPETFIDQENKTPEHGRGAWTRVGIGFDYRYALSEDPAVRIGTVADESLAHWSVAAGCYAVQRRLIKLGHLDRLGAHERGVFGPRTKVAVEEFQRAHRDPDGGARLDDDGTVGRSDARALFYPIVRRAEREYVIPNYYIVGLINHESALDPGAVGYYIYYADSDTGVLDYRGVDRGMGQINSLFNPQVSWLESFSPRLSFEWAADRLRSFHDRYAEQYPKQGEGVLWDAALCAHNNPWAAGEWAREGYPPTEQAKNYVASVKNSIF